MEATLFLPQINSATRRIGRSLSLAIIILFQLLSLKSEAKAKPNLRLANIKTIQDQETAAIAELKSDSNNLRKTATSLRVFQRVLLDNRQDFEISMRSIVAIAAVCYWNAAKETCQRELAGLSATLMSLGESRLAKILEARQIETDRETSAQDEAAFMVSAGSQRGERELHKN